MEVKRVSLVADAELYHVKSYVKNPGDLFKLLNDDSKFEKHPLYFYHRDQDEIVQKTQSRASYWFGAYAQATGEAGQYAIGKDGQQVLVPTSYVRSYEFPPEILELKERIEKEFDMKFNSCLVGKFDSPLDRVGFHSDESKGLGKNPFIASVSFGKGREFVLKSKKAREKLSILLEEGDLLVMRNNSNVKYLHGVPPDPECNPSNCRINLTFRNYTYHQDEIDWTIANKPQNL
eukprot:TRINITY_DN27843_c0_g1_i1.p1 TRINITY_DN27843_c0_g1~~TRINITY_DN27843_c0_g1_i1.p1  ORF type:complete len:250 (-),score=67.41 TRINITY_DN27843_c0_g1_i1:39-737(-)